MGTPWGDLRDRLEVSEALRFRDTVLNFERFLRPSIDGLEVTQGIQYYRAERHLTNADDRGSDNSVVLVANKPAWARVYVRSGILGVSHNVTGQLVVEQRGNPLLPWITAASLSPQAPGSVATQSNPDYAAERSSLASTLNFIIPQAAMWGVIRVTVRLWAVGGDPAAPLDTSVTTLNVTLLQTLRLRGVLINYNGPDPTVNPTNPPTINLAAPTVANLQATAAWTLTTNPIESQGVFSSAGTLLWGTPLTGVATNPGGCSPQWLQLNAAVAQVRANDGNRADVIYYGLLPAGTPIANVGGCESSGVSTGPNGAQQTMAHEIGHGAGLAHGPCGTPGDPNYPAYEPYDPANTPTAALGEYGLDINNGTLHPPTDKDYMSYCGPAWISLFHQGRLTNNAKLNPQTVGISRWRPPVLVDPYLWPWEYIPDPPPWERHPGDMRMKAEPVISIVGLVTAEREVQVQSVMRVTALPAVAEARATAYVAQLIGREGNVVASAPVMRLESRGCGCASTGQEPPSEREPFAFQALVLNAEPGSALRIVRQEREVEADKEVWLRRAPEHAPKIGGFSVRVAKGTGRARWEARGAGDQPLAFSLQFSKDEGRSWNGVAVGLSGEKYEFELANLPSSTVIFRLLAHDGFFTSQADSRPVRLPQRGPTVSILHPPAGPALIAGQTMRLWAAVTTVTGEPIDPQACRWLLDGKEAARGADAWTTAPKAGEHRCRLIVTDDGGESEASVSFTTIDPGSPDTSGDYRQTGGPSRPSQTRPARARRGGKFAR